MVKKIKELCSMSNIMLNVLERSCGFGKNTVCRRDTRKPSVNKAKKAEDAFSMTVDDLIFMDEMLED